MSKTKFTALGEVLTKQKKEGDEGKPKRHIRTSRDIILPAQTITKKDGKKVNLPEERIPAGSFIQLLDPNRGSIKKPDFVNYDIVFISDED